MISTAGARNGGMLVARNELTMPKWVKEQTDRIGPKPPPPPMTPENNPTSSKQSGFPPKAKQPEPDYEVIEFSNQQYSNAPLRPNSASSGSKTPDNKLKCTLCGSGNPWVTCDECSQQLFCASCDDMFHKHPKRKGHQRKTIDKSRPPLPPKVLSGQSAPAPPVAPPRRNKRGFMTPLMQRKDQGNTGSRPFTETTSPTPSSKSLSLRDRMGSLPRGLNLLNRPLPETPKTPSESSRSTTPKSVFDSIQRPPSVALEKIKSKANATLDRMQILQQRYRQQKEQMERERSGSLIDQHQIALQHHRMAAQKSNQLGSRGMSSSVFNLNEMNSKQPISNNSWMNNSIQQAQSMAQLNCGNCGQHQLQWNSHNQPGMRKAQEPWGNQLISQQNLNRSNMSLNVSAGFSMQPQMNNMYPPPAFMNQRNFMPSIYPHPYMGGMPLMNPGLMCMPPPTSRVVSRAGSRLTSPAISRTSVTVRRKQRSAYIDGEATDDEDSDDNDARSIASIRSSIARSRQRRISSASQFQLDDDIESNQAKLHRNRARNQRRDSIAKSVHSDWTPVRKDSSANNNRSADSGFNSPLKPSRIYSDLDSEGSGTRALVQAKIEQKLREESLMQKQSRPKKQSRSPHPQKTSSAVQTPAVKKSNERQKPGNHELEQEKLSKSEIEKAIGRKCGSKPTEVLKVKSRSTDEEERTASEKEKLDESGSERSTESDIKQEIEESRSSNINEIQEDELGPPPSTPDHEWECEFCTFVNEANIKICSICCKTPSTQPIKATSTPSKQNQNENECMKKSRNKSEKKKIETMEKSPSTPSAPSSAQHIVDNDTLNPNEICAAETLGNKESIQDVWASLDEHIQATANEVALQAQSIKPTKKPSTSKSIINLRASQGEENDTSPSPQNISTQTYDTLPVQNTLIGNESNMKQTPQPFFDDVMQESDLYKYTTEELNAAIKYCGPETHPLVWLRDNWPKIIQTVQSLATKYGQERAENIIGTISQMEAREALRMHAGNIWQSVSECIEQRQRKYREISSKGNFSREDIVTALTTHHGNVESALSDLGHTQLKPFLMRIWGSPGGAENESGSQLSPNTTSLATPSNMDKDIHKFLRANASDCMQIPNSIGAYLINNQASSLHNRPVSFNSPFENINHTSNNASTHSTDSKAPAHSPLQLESLLGNKNVLKDLETLIGNMEQNQSENIIRSSPNTIANVNTKLGNEYDSETMRILAKSPIIPSKLKTPTKNDNDIKSFVWQHIQEIMPNLVQQVELELVEGSKNKFKSNMEEDEKNTKAEVDRDAPILPPPPIDQDEFLMEEVIKPNIKKANIREELPPQYVYAAEIATFTLAFDKALDLEHEEEFEFKELSEAVKNVYPLVKDSTNKYLPDEFNTNQIASHVSATDLQKAESEEVLPLPFGNELIFVIERDENENINIQAGDTPTVDKYSPTQSQLGRLSTINKTLKETKSPTELPDSTIFNGDLDLTRHKILNYPTENSGEAIIGHKPIKVLPAVPSNVNTTTKSQSAAETLTTENQHQSVKYQLQNLEQNPESTNGINSLQLHKSDTNSSSNNSISLDSYTQGGNQSNAVIVESISITSNETESFGNISKFTKSNKSPFNQSAENEGHSVNESSSTLHINKKISKIPVRRSASNKSLVNNLSQKQATEITPSESKMLALEPTPNTANEIFLLREAEEANSIVQYASNSTLYSSISQTSSFKPSSEFIPSGDPSKQNLTELVKDTQRLIQQMKDEISIDEFESSTDDGAYSDEFSEDYDDDREEVETWEEVEEEEDDGDEEYDITEDFNEETGAMSTEEDSISTPYSSPPHEESQDQMTAQNSSAFFPTIESLTHSPAFTNEHFQQGMPIENDNNDTNKKNTSVGKTATVTKTENVPNNLESSLLSLQFIESENNLPDLPVEIILPYQTANDVEISTENNFGILNETENRPTPTESNSATNEVSATTSVSGELRALEVLAVDKPMQNNHEDNQDNTLNGKYVAQSIKSTQNIEVVPSYSTMPVTMTVKSDNNNPGNKTENLASIQNLETAILSESDGITNGNLRSTNSSNNKSASSDEAFKKNNTVSLPSQLNRSTQANAKASQTTDNPIKSATTSSRIPKPKEISKKQRPKEAPISKQRSDGKNKLYTRSKSFSGPTTPIGISSVKTISQKFINPLINTQTKTMKQQPDVARKSSIAETINKLTKTSTHSEKPTLSSLFKSRTQPRIPKKKYHETCFSDDDYESSSEEEVQIEALEVKQRKLSVPVFKAYPSVQEPSEIKTEELVEKFMREELAKTVAEAQIAATLVSMKFSQDVSLWAAKECSDLDHAIALLKQECELCSGTCALNQIVSMLKCTHKCCKQCAKTYFTVQITERSINDCSCPFCKLPELHNQNEHEDENLEYFSNLDIFLKNIVEPEVHELFQRKLRDRTLLKDPNFKWCVQCSSGFFARPKQKRLICPDCGSVTCSQCRKTWQKQHEGISCEQFAKWELANDPEVQAKGVQQHLEQNGIDCPKCKFKYSLARGGCMHFTCTQCKFEFCYGCSKPFMMGAKCSISPYCAKLGLHAHHPRNCLFYLRDKLPVQLQILLKNNNVAYEVDPIEGPNSSDENDPSSSRKKEPICSIPIQKETPNGLVDTRCNGDVPEKHAGMCRNHYVEYLTAKVARAKIDPLPIFDLTDCVQELRRRGLPLPERGPWDTDEIYKNMCAEVIRDKIPLDMD